ncbi:MAG: FixH family protein [Chloroflexi bacterium]|nr:FixH family protein [Chloroflexota bacterium]MBI3742528.1 FixH family protein [Chloroflexota bacterium]
MQNKSRAWLELIFFVLTFALAACASTPTPIALPPTATPALSPTRVPPTATVTSSANNLRVTLTTNPSPPGMGNVEFVIQIRDANNQPVNDAVVQISGSDMMMYGMAFFGKAIAQENGRYVLISNLDSEGAWNITVQVSRPGAPIFFQMFDLAVRGY